MIVTIASGIASRISRSISLAAIGIRSLSMRPASIGPVKALLRRIDLRDLRAVIATARADGADSVRPAVMDWLSGQTE